MCSKPPKDIQAKNVVDVESSEVLWHLLSDLDGVDIESTRNWETLAFGLLGGVDIAQQSNLLRDRPVRVQIQTHRASFAHFCQTMQLGFEEYALNNQWTAEQVADLLELTENVFYINRRGVWKLGRMGDGQPWWAENKIGKRWHQDIFSPKRGEKLWLVEDISSKSIDGIIHLVLAEQCAHFINSTGIEVQVQNWINHIRRPSLRKSWQSILSTQSEYFWAAVQVYHEIHAAADIAFRERYIQFLLQCSDHLQCPELKSMTLDFRKSQRYWQQLSTVLLADSSVMLKKIPELDWTDIETVFDSSEKFENEESVQNIEGRLSLMEDSIQRIVESEQRFFVMMSELLSGLARGRILVERAPV